MYVCNLYTQDFGKELEICFKSRTSSVNFKFKINFLEHSEMRIRKIGFKKISNEFEL